MSIIAEVLNGLALETKRTVARASVAGLQAIAEDAERLTGIGNLYAQVARVKLAELAKKVDVVP